MTQESRKGPETRSRSLGVPICKMEMVLCSSFLQGTIVRMKICGPSSGQHCTQRSILANLSSPGGGSNPLVWGEAGMGV